MTNSPWEAPSRGSRVRSFDVFDTLIARRCINAREILARIEEQGYPDFVRKRSAAGRRVHSDRKTYSLKDVYLDLVTEGVYNQTEARILHGLELQLEMENCIPIQRNLDRVRDGDLLVSDMYHSAEFMRTLLTKAGLQSDYKLFVSPAGKLTGSIWPEILEKHSILHHVGDNPKSDMISPAEFGIRSRMSTLHRPSKIETLLMSHGQGSLARCIREVRLAASFDDDVHDYLHSRSCQLNFPILVLLSRLINSEVKALEMSRVAFVTRDCFNLKRVFKSMYGAVASTDYFASRKILRSSSPTYLEYLELLCPGTLLVELDTSGASLSQALNRGLKLGKTIAPTVFTGIFLDGKLQKYRGLVRHPRPPQPVIHHFTNMRRVGHRVPVLLEMLNFAPYPSVEDVIRLPRSGRYHPVFQDRSLIEEYQDPSLIHLMNETIRTCVTLAPWDDVVAESEGKNLTELLDTLLKELAGCHRLLDIFPRLMIDAVPEEKSFWAGLGGGGRRQLRGFVKKLVGNRRQLTTGFSTARARSRSWLSRRST